MFEFTGAYGLPGIDAVRESIELAFTWGGTEYNKSFIHPALLDGAARDAGHPTATPAGAATILRPGLMMMASPTTKKWSQWNGSGRLGGLLVYAAQTQTYGADADRWFGYILVGGNVQSSKLLIPGASARGLAASGGVAAQAACRTALAAAGFKLDDTPYQA